MVSHRFELADTSQVFATQLMRQADGLIKSLVYPGN
jgi:hypothetical protein